MKRRLAFAALAAFVGFGLCAAAQDQQKTVPPDKPDRPGPHAWLKEALKLTPEQEAKIREFHQARMADRKALEDQMSQIRDGMRALRQNGTIDPAKMNPLIDRMFKLRADQAKAMLQKSLEWRKIFTPEQLEVLKEAAPRFQRRLRMMRNRFRWGRGWMMRGRDFDRVPREPGPEPGMDPERDPGEGLGAGSEPDFDLDPWLMERGPDFGMDPEMFPGMGMNMGPEWGMDLDRDLMMFEPLLYFLTSRGQTGPGSK
jgi:Spy/CpxP family protein refolding chaperone